MLQSSLKFRRSNVSAFVSRNSNFPYRFCFLLSSETVWDWPRR